MFKALSVMVIVLVIFAFIGTMIYGSFTPFTVFNYSEGSRTGLMNKISHKGLICKTWEGYILVGNGQNVQPEEFHFTVKDEAVAHQLETLGGKVVTLNYQQYFFTSPCWGDTDYQINSVMEAK